MPPPLRDDVQLTRQQIQSLSSADRLAAFFATLRYPDDARLPMTPGALQLNAALTNATRRVERLTSVAGGALQVFLFELTSVTVAHTRALTRAFRNRAGNFLLVLTDDYERIDFVLLQREAPKSGSSRRGVIVRPRTLSVDRRDPGRVPLRVLRRFTFTEYDEDGRRDPYAQWDKLNSAYTVAEWSEPLFNNRALFSDYYLNQRLPELDEWNAPERNRAFREIRAQFAQARRRFADADAATTRDELIRPLLETLGFRVTPGPGGDEPDFRLYADGADEDSGEGSDEQCAFVLAYAWNRYLDGKDGQRDDERPAENPGAQVVTLLESGEAKWGLVTNGKLWRLYSARAHSRATNYYEINLEETLASPDPGEPFRYFYLFFRAAAFAPPPPEGEGAFLDWLVEQSQAYARELGRRLKGRVFEHIFPHFAEGFIQTIGGPKALLELDEEERAQRLDQVYQGTLTFLYRLLFLLYAESRDLLPVREVRGYYQISLRKLKEEIAERAGPLEDQVAGRLEQAYGAGADDTALYDRLLELFGMIDQGRKARNVPAYNGGLFITDPDEEDEGREAEAARFLEQTRLSDRYLALGLDLLARDVDSRRGDLGFIDYKSLGVRQLGSIYEGLLEFHLTIDGESAEPDASPVHLISDKGERKATGSYYTPDYIVKYIVRHTVGPVLDEKLDALRPRLREAERRFHRVVRRKRETEKTTPDEPALLRDVAGDVLHDLFDVKILDPAAGSGHFLVEAVDYVTDRLVRFLDGYPFLGIFFEDMRAAILEEMERQQVTVDPARLTDVTLLKRHVLKRCIYGVDLNPMAVELAKVSLWLDCFTLGAPLSFLDHHLRCGNSLIGAMAEEVAEDFESELPLFGTGPFSGLLRAAEIMRGISTIADVTLEQVRESGHLFEAFDEAATPYKQLLDIRVAQHFDVARADEFLRTHTPEQALEIVRGRVEEVKPIYQEVVEQTRTLYDEKRFFHWDLEFPEVFIDLERAQWKKDGGFDAVVGNPPYVRSVRLKDAAPAAWSYYSQVYRAAAKREFDIYLCFAEQGLCLLNPSGWFGMIMPNKWLTTRVGEALRALLSEHQAIERLVDFGHFQVFERVTTYTCLLFLAGSPRQAFFVANLNEAKKGTRPLPDGEGNWQAGDVTLEDLSPDAWVFALGPAGSLLDKLQKFSCLEDIASVFKGTGTSADFVFFMERRGDQFYSRSLERWVEIEDALMRPALTGQDIDPYQHDPGNYLLFPYRLVGEEVNLIPADEMTAQYPQAWEYLNHPTNRETLEGRDKGAFSNRDDWYAYGRPQNMHLLKKDKIVGPDVAGQAEFAYDSEGRYIIDTVYAIRTNEDVQFSLLALTTLLNSTLMTFFLKQTGTDLRGGYFRMKTAYLNPFPIPRIHFTTPQAERERLAADLIARYERGEHQALLAEVEALLPKTADGDFLAFQLDATGAEEKSDVVHDLLAHLAEQMIALHKQKQERVAAFWDALESVTDADTFEDLSEHGKWEASLWKDPACRPYVDQESRSTRHLDEGLGWDRDCYEAFARMLAGKTSVTGPIIDVYRERHPAYRRLVERIASTDALIDQIVYRLYGLTDEEVAVVEGKTQE